ncbi:MAG: DUF3786 domain-containing protein [Clostridiales Family XIII bacterium]|nr:DUF3786 domain-containing protein [Clostridiales Family XIII bacterium]
MSLNLRPEFEDKQNVGAPFAHYLALYEAADPLEIAGRTGLVYDAGSGRFAVTLVGTAYYVNHPAFLAVEEAVADGPAAETQKTTSPLCSCDGVLRRPYEEILLLRYLIGGRYVPYGGKRLSYAEMPWGNVYLSQFKGRVVSRLAREFGKDPASLARAARSVPGLRHELLGGCDAGVRFEFLDNLYMSILLWEGDEEFPPSAQVLFDDNFRYAFTAEDMAVVGDVAIGTLKRYNG